MSLDSELEACSSPAERISENEWRKTFRPGPGFIGFRGHFPGRPVLPAIVQLRMLRLLVEEAIGPAELLDITSAKFLSPAVPDVLLAVRIRRRADRWTAEMEAMECGAPSAVSEFKFKVSSYGQNAIPSPESPAD